MFQISGFRHTGNLKMNEEIHHRVKEMEKLRGVLRAIWRNKKMLVEAMKVKGSC